MLFINGVEFLRHLICLCFEGVESVKTEMDSNKVTVVGTVDPTKIRDRLLQKTKKKVDLISPQPPPKKDKEDNPKQENNKSNQKNSDEKKSKEKEVRIFPIFTFLKIPFL